uniref:CCHC-type domain-containing protein n=1 Tax=Schizaphis graminum TaxID=13262 RepID=A0A2S2PN13_SCHGA
MPKEQKQVFNFNGRGMRVYNAPVYLGHEGEHQNPPRLRRKGGNLRLCYNCHKGGHLARDCDVRSTPRPVRSVPPTAARGRSSSRSKRSSSRDRYSSAREGPSSASGPKSSVRVPTSSPKSSAGTSWGSGWGRWASTPALTTRRTQKKEKWTVDSSV